MLHLPVSFINRITKTEFPGFLLCFTKDPLFISFRDHNSCACTLCLPCCDIAILHIDSVAPGLSILLLALFVSPTCQHPVLDLYRSAKGKFIIILISYFCQNIEIFYKL